MNKDFVQKRLGGPETVWNKVKYDKDAIVEASAGTGKTYALQSIVLKLLAEKKIDSVRNLLLVTYTEKAAGELKDRIRKILVEADCLPVDFDEVTICTIHSFCRQLLSEYAFENRVPMQMEICASDGDLVHKAILAALHSQEFADRWGADFADEMESAKLDADKLVLKAEARFKKRVDPDACMLDWLVDHAQTVFEKMRQQASSMTFDDLVVRASSVIDAEAAKEAQGHASELLRAIRQKYRIALVDEFQDTDPAQWGIFRQIFSHRVNRISEGPKPLQGALLVVGDPKQAIYSFRGADVGTYLQARTYIADEAEGQIAQTLDTTFRSTPELVKAFNRIFGGKVGNDRAWFENMSEGGLSTGSISYAAVKAPSDSEKFLGIRYAENFGAPVELLESLPHKPRIPDFWSSGYGSKGICLPEFLCNAATEMKRLKDLSPAYTVVDSKTKMEKPRRLGYGDMCILVRSGSDARKAQEILAENGIPYSVYKEKGIYASEEAEALLALFDFLAVPSRRGRLEALLLTPLFGYRPDQLAARLAKEDASFSAVIENWQQLVVQRKWNLLFEGILNETCLAYPRKDDFGFDRRWAATRQILDKLLEQKGRLAQTIDEFAETLRAWRQDDSRAGEEGALRRRESQADCVQIMTMHVSKGLEFPVVFVAWGFGELAKQVEKEEKAAAIREEKRLLYVALTRAEHKLYLPWSQFAQHTRRKTKRDGTVVAEWDETGLGSASSALTILDPAHAAQSQQNPDLGFLARGIRACFGNDEAAKANVVMTQGRIEAFRENLTNSQERPSEQQGEARPEQELIDSAAEIPVYEIDKNESLGMHILDDSYSSLHRQKARKVVEPMEPVGEDEDADLPPSAARAPTLLPRNNISGDVFHEIMETLCKTDDSDFAEKGLTGALGFQSVGRSMLKDLFANEVFIGLIRRIMRKHALQGKVTESESTELVLARMAWRALNVPIHIGTAEFCLRDIPFRDRRAELGFVVNRNGAFGEVVTNENTFNGKIDLLVRPQGRQGPVYILDWKTNSLKDYGLESLKSAMDESDYHLQYKFYSLAVRQWLQGVKLGGVAYLFVRAGESSEQVANPTGVFVADENEVSGEACRTAIRAVLEGVGK